MKHYLATLSLLYFAAFLTASAPALAENPAENGALTTEDLWVREAPPGARMLAGYGKLTNNGAAPRVLVGASSKAFKQIEIHRTIIEQDVVSMVRQDRIEIAPGTALVLEPNSYHWMLMGPRNRLKSGDTLKLLLHFESGASQEITLRVRSALDRNH